MKQDMKFGEDGLSVDWYAVGNLSGLEPYVGRNIAARGKLIDMQTAGQPFFGLVDSLFPVDIVREGRLAKAEVNSRQTAYILEASFPVRGKYMMTPETQVRVPPRGSEKSPPDNSRGVQIEYRLINGVYEPQIE